MLWQISLMNACKRRKIKNFRETSCKRHKRLDILFPNILSPKNKKFSILMKDFQVSWPSPVAHNFSLNRLTLRFKNNNNFLKQNFYNSFIKKMNYANTSSNRPTRASIKMNNSLTY